jgi:hypothetical protein
MAPNALYLVELASGGLSLMPRQSPFCVVLSKDERQHLESIVRQYTSPYCYVIRAKIILLASQGLSNDVRYAPDRLGAANTDDMRYRGLSGRRNHQAHCLKAP